MTQFEPMNRCTLDASAESLSGTAPLAQGWLLVSSEGSWGPQAVDKALGQRLSRWVADRQLKVLLVRKHNRNVTRDLRYWLSDAKGGLVSGDLIDLDTPPDVSESEPAEPMLVICTNGSRDQCCAIEGISLRKHLQGSLTEIQLRNVWEGTHIGGHRFAPTALYLPGNLVYGRLTADVATSILQHGTLENRYLRGRSHYPACVQVLECEIPRFSEIDWVQFADCSTGKHTHVGLYKGERLVYELAPVSTPPRLESCGGSQVMGNKWLVTQL